MVSSSTSSQTASRQDVIDALLSASRAMVAIAARSLLDLDADVTLPQYRVLVVLASRGGQRVVDIAAEFQVDASAATRMCDRLVRKGLIRRDRSEGDRREVVLALTPAGRNLVRSVTSRRRREFARLVDSLDPAVFEAVTMAMRALTTSAGEISEPRLRRRLAR